MSGILTPSPTFQTFTQNGSLNAFGTLNTYAAGTSTPIATFTDATLGTPNANPLTFNALGQAVIWLTPGLSYKFVWFDSFGNQIDSRDQINSSFTLTNSLIPANNNVLDIGSPTFQWRNGYFGTNIYIGGQPVFTPQTAAELAASVTPTNIGYLPGDVRRYGADPTGVADSTTAITNAFLTGQRITGGGPENTYRYTSNISIPQSVTSVMADWMGATLKPTTVAGSTPIFSAANAAAAATTTVTASIFIGQVVFVVASASGLSVGQIANIQAANQPTFWGRIKAINVLNVTLDTAAPINYTGPFTFTAYAPFLQRFDFRNARFDGSALTAVSASLGQLFRLVNVQVVNLQDLECLNFSNSTGSNQLTLAEVFLCLQVDIRAFHFHDNPIQLGAGITACAIEVDDCNQVNVANNIVEGSHFGINITRCAIAGATSNRLRGQRHYEIQAALGLFSVRGIKISNCAVAQFVGNWVEDYITPIKCDNSFQVICTGNVLRNQMGAAAADYTDAAIAISTCGPGNNISNNDVENASGIGILLAGVGGTGQSVRGQIIGNRIVKCQAQAINIVGLEAIISGNYFEDWDLSNTYAPAIGNQAQANIMSGGQIRDNTFTHNVTVTKPLLAGPGVTGFAYIVNGNRSTTGNPLLSGVAVSATADGFFNSGSSTVTNTNTQVVVPHTLFRAPLADEITITGTNLPTTAPGLVYITGITGSQFTVNTTAAMGATGFAFSWQARIKQPYTV
jgi:hypothetical protein